MKKAFVNLTIASVFSDGNVSYIIVTVMFLTFSNQKATAVAIH